MYKTLYEATEYTGWITHFKITFSGLQCIWVTGLGPSKSDVEAPSQDGVGVTIRRPSNKTDSQAAPQDQLPSEQTGPNSESEGGANTIGAEFARATGFSISDAFRRARKPNMALGEPGGALAPSGRGECSRSQAQF